MRKTLCISSVILFCLAACAYAYQIKDAHFKQDKKGLVHIYYWLDNPHNDTFEITLMLSSDGGITFQWNMKSVEGDAGDDIRGSGLKHVIWDVEKDHPYLSGNKFVISVDAKRKGKYLGMVFIPAGEFLMGSQAEDLDEHPRHRVYLDAFYMDKYEVANYQYDKCVRAGKCRKQNFSKCWGWSGVCSNGITIRSFV